MTTIAVRYGVIAADSMLNRGGSAGGSISKIERMPDGCIIGSTGRCGDSAAFRQWWRSSGAPEQPPKLDDGFMAIILRPSGAVDFCDSGCVPYRVDADFHAIGSGWEFAMGAMAMGASAEAAVRVACQFDQASAEPIYLEGPLDHA